MRNLLGVMLVLSVLVVSSCVIVEECLPTGGTLTGGTVVDTVPAEVHDMTEEDVFALIKSGGITSSQISVKGVKLGDHFAEIRDNLGLPYSMEEFESGAVINARYLHAETNVTTVIFHLENDIITRIVVRAEYNENLHGETIINRSKDDITRFFGKPDFFDDAVALRTYYYKDIGLEIYHRRRKMLGFGLIPEGSAKELYRN